MMTGKSNWTNFAGYSGPGAQSSRSADRIPLVNLAEPTPSPTHEEHSRWADDGGRNWRDRNVD